MEVLLDYEGEELAKGGFDVAVPLSYDACDGRLSVSVYPAFESVARDVLTGAPDPFTADVFARLRDGIAQEMRALGYVEDRHEYASYGTILRATAGGDVLDGTAVCTDADDARNQTSFDLSASVRAGCLFVGHTVGGAIVAAAVSHRSPDGAPGTVVEIGCECLRAYRKRGYASSCAARAAKEILARGGIPEYRCRHTNIASYKTAIRAGFVPVGRYYYYVFRKEGT